MTLLDKNKDSKLILTLSDSFRKVLAAESLNQRFRIRDGKYKKLSRFAGVGNHDQILKGVLGFAEKSEDYSRELGCNRLGHGDWIGTCLVISVRAITKGEVNLPVFIGVPAILLPVATLACWIPARRASRIGPMAALGTSKSRTSRPTL